MKIKYDANLLKTMAVFDAVTHVPLKDCFIDKDDSVVFVVDEQYWSKAIGKRGVNAKKMEKLLNRKIKIVGYTTLLPQFVRNLVYPLEVNEVKEHEGVVTISGKNTHTKALLIGKNSQNLKNYLQIIQRYFSHVKQLKVI